MHFPYAALGIHDFDFVPVTAAVRLQFRLQHIARVLEAGLPNQLLQGDDRARLAQAQDIILVNPIGCGV